MNKFDIYEYFRSAALKEAGEEEPSQEEVTTQPETQATQKMAEQPPAAVPGPVQTPFDKFTGSTIKNIKFQKHENGGEITIELVSKSGAPTIPVRISWAGDRVTMTHNGVVALT